MTLLAAYNFDESSGDFLDVTGGGHNIPIGTNAARAEGHTGSALTKINTGLPVLAQPAIGQTAARTIMFWLLGTGGTWWVRWNADALGSGTWGILNLSGNVAVQARDTSGALLSPRPQVPHPSDGQWHHYAATYDGATVRLYLDAVQVSSGSLAGGLYASADRVDVAEWSTAATFMDDLRIYDEALDQATIATLMDTPVTAGPTEVTGAGSGSGGGGGAATGVREVTAVGAAVGGGVGTAAGTPEPSATPGTAAGAGGGTGTAVGVREVSAAAGGVGGGVGAAVGASNAVVVAGVGAGFAGGVGVAAGVREVVAIVAGHGGGVGAAVGVREVVGVAVGVGGGVGAAVTDVPRPPTLHTFAVPSESRVFTVPAETRSWEV
jgi:hypothetical protein